MVPGTQQEVEKHWSQYGLEPLNLWAFHLKYKKKDSKKKKLLQLNKVSTNNSKKNISVAYNKLRKQIVNVILTN